MKNLIYCLALLTMWPSIVYSQEWVPVIVSTKAYVPHQYSVTNYYTEWRPVDVPVVKYYPIQQHHFIQPVIFVQPKTCLCWWCNRPYYYVYPNVYQYYPAKY